MSSEWNRIKVRDLGRIVTGKTPPTSRSDYFGGLIPFLTPTDMPDGQKYVEAERRLTEAGVMQVKNCLVQKGVAVSCIGWQMGKSVLITEPTVTNQQINTVVVDESRFDLSFVYYLLSSMRAEIFELGATPTRTPIVNKSTFGDIDLVIPSLHLQREISQLGEALDDRITLLRETNATLEAIAQAIFKSWFVDFDPVRAKLEGRAPEGMDEATARLFPDSFEESELGLVPRGWRVGEVSEVAILKGGKQLEKEAFEGNGTNPVFGGAGEMGRSNLSNASGFVITVGRVGAYCGQFFWHIGEAWVNNNASQIKPRNDAQSIWMYQWLKSVNMDLIKKGAAQPFVSNGDIALLKITIPPERVIDRFVEAAEPIFR
jgi:type I restriction enzyme S subunit